MKVLRLILLSLLASLIAGLIIGTIIRLRLEREPVRYFVGQTDSWALGHKAQHESDGFTLTAASYWARLQGTSSTSARLFSVRATTKSRSERRFR